MPIDRNPKQHKLGQAKRRNLFATLLADIAFQKIKIEKERDEETNEVIGLNILCKNVDLPDVFDLAKVTRTHVHIREKLYPDPESHDYFFNIHIS